MYAIKLLCWISGIISSVGAMYLGLRAIGYDVFMQMGLEQFMLPFAYTVGIAGAVCFALLILKLFCCDGCKKWDNNSCRSSDRT